MWALGRMLDNMVALQKTETVDWESRRIVLGLSKAVAMLTQSRASLGRRGRDRATGGVAKGDVGKQTAIRPREWRGRAKVIALDSGEAEEGVLETGCPDGGRAETGTGDL